MNLFFQANPAKVVYKETLNGVLIVKFKVKNCSFKSTLSFETPFKKCLLMQYVQLISYKRYLECTLIQWRLSMYP